MAYHYLCPEIEMLHLAVSWPIGALALWIVARILPGIRHMVFA